MLFGDSFAIQDESASRRPGRRLGLTLWPVATHPLKFTVQSLSVEQLSNVAYLKNISVLALFSRLEAEDDGDTDATFEFPIDQFKSAFDPTSFDDPISFADDFGFCFTLSGVDSSILARSRCVSFAAVIPNHDFVGHKLLKCSDLFDLFPALSRFSIRFPIRPPPFSQMSFIPFKHKLQMFQPRRTPTQLPWEKWDKLKRWRDHLSPVTDFLLIGSDSIAGQAARLRKAGITHIINCAAQLVTTVPGFTHLDIPMNDGGDENVISSIFRTTVFIQKAARANGRVLIHCAEGVSRSVAVSIGYFIITEKSDYQSVFKRIREKRRVANPNAKFIAQLIQLGEIIGATPTKTCFFSQKKLIPFAITERRGRILALPVCRELPPDDSNCWVVVKYGMCESLWRGDKNPAGDLLVHIPAGAPPQMRSCTEEFVRDITSCLRLNKPTFS
jgi:predicted protein tyrosine phosphatase